jgi:hypothetical protein
MVFGVRPVRSQPNVGELGRSTGHRRGQEFESPCLSNLWTQTAAGLHLGSEQPQGHLSVRNSGPNLVGACSPVKRTPENASGFPIALG